MRWVEVNVVSYEGQHHICPWCCCHGDHYLTLSSQGQSIEWYIERNWNARLDHDLNTRHGGNRKLTLQHADSQNTSFCNGESKGVGGVRTSFGYLPCESGSDRVGSIFVWRYTSMIRGHNRVVIGSQIVNGTVANVLEGLRGSVRGKEEVGREEGGIVGNRAPTYSVGAGGCGRSKINSTC